MKNARVFALAFLCFNGTISYLLNLRPLLLFKDAKKFALLLFLPEYNPLKNPTLFLRLPENNACKFKNECLCVFMLDEMFSNV